MRVWVTLIVLFGAGRALSAPGEVPVSAAMRRSLEPGQVAEVPVIAPSGSRIHLKLDQLRLDVVVRVVGPSGAVLGTVTNTTHRTDPLTLTVISAEAGSHRISVSLEKPDSSPGSFQLKLDPVTPATERDRQRIQAETLRAEADRVSYGDDSKAYPQALEQYAQSEAIWRKLDDPLELAITLTRHSELLDLTSQLQKETELLTEALALWRRAGEPEGEVDCLTGLGNVQSNTGEPRAGLALLEQALVLRRKLGPEPYGEGAILNNLAGAYDNLGDFPAGAERYAQALPFARQSGDPLAEAIVLRNQASDLALLGQFNRSRAQLLEVRDRFHALHRPFEEGTTEYTIGATYRHDKDYPNALLHYQTALKLLEGAGDKRFSAMTLQNIGLLRIDERQYDEASRSFELALQKMTGVGDARTVAGLKVDLGRVLVERGRFQEGVAALRAARREVQDLGHRAYETLLLTSLAKAERGLGQLDEARGHVLEALDLTEKLRSTIPGPSARAAYLEAEHQRYLLLVEVLMDLHARDPDQGWNAEALRASETARARSLLEVIAEGQADIHLDVAPEMRKAEQDIDARMELKRKTQQALLARVHTPQEADALERAIETLRAEREALEVKMRASSPAYASLTQPQALSLQEIRAQALDESTALVEILLGEKRSFVWVVSSTGITSALLPSRKVIETAALAVHRRWSNPAATDDGRQRARALSSMLLQPVAPALSSPRLLIAADGALELIPFAALPDPRTGRPLIDGHELVDVPSASVLAMLRNRRPNRPAFAAEVAVVADPVVSRSDVRLQGAEAATIAALAPDLQRSLEDTGMRTLERLPATREEAESIATHAGPARIFSALGFEANLPVALGTDVAQARIVHFASHALLDAKRPELSGIVLSLYDEQGQPRDGFLPLADVYRLRLAADLVVLSACRTGLGKEVRGEGVVGLTRGFMFAGAPRVVASVWKVSDRATAALMDRFYGLLLGEHLSPAAALRAAQLELKKERRFSTPYAWAGFMLHGDWAPMTGPVTGKGSPRPLTIQLAH